MTTVETSAFPVVWEKSGDEEIGWELDNIHTPFPIVGLSADYFLRGVRVGFMEPSRRLRLRTWVEARLVNGYLYWGRVSEVGVEDLEGAEREARIAGVKWAREVRAWWDGEALPALLDAYAWMRNVQTGALPLSELADAWDELWRRIPELFGIHFVTTTGAYGAARNLSQTYGEIFDPEPGDHALVLVSGLSRELQHVERDLQALTEDAQRRPGVADGIRSAAEPDDLLDVEGGGEFLRLFDGFIGEHGHCGQPYDDIALPSWSDEPASVLEEVSKRLDSPPPDAEERRLGLRRRSDEFAAAARAKLADRPDDLERFEDALALAVEAGPLTEDHNYWMDRMCHAHVRGLCVGVGQRLVNEGMLDEAKDVFLAEAAEVADALRAPRDLRPLLSERRSLLERYAAMEAPQRLGKQEEEEEDRGETQVTPDEPGVVAGVGVSPGRARGPVRIVLSDTDFGTVQPGDVVVCRSSNLSWVPVIAIACALVTDVGGPLEHAAVIAREFGIPAVIDAKRAFDVLVNGQIVEVDGGEGLVRLL